MFTRIEDCFEKTFLGKPKVKWNDFNDGLSELRRDYESLALSKTHPILLSLLRDTNRNVGNTNYGIFAPLILSAQNGDGSKLEEIEYAYLYYLLTDECVMLWAAVGGTGQTKLDAVTTLAGVVLEGGELKGYAPIEQILGRFCAATYLRNNYQPLPPNV